MREAKSAGEGKRHDGTRPIRPRPLDHRRGRPILRSERARFAVGYLFLSGLTSVAKQLFGLKELRLLIGNTTNRETVETLTETKLDRNLGLRNDDPAE